MIGQITGRKGRINKDWKRHDPMFTGAKNLHTERWVTFFAKCGYEVHLIIDEPVDYEGVIIHCLNLEVKKNLSYFFKKLFRIKRLIRKIEPDILHAHTITTEG